jgi:hypothetical protein
MKTKLNYRGWTSTRFEVRITKGPQWLSSRTVWFAKRSHGAETSAVALLLEIATSLSPERVAPSTFAGGYGGQAQ